MALVNLGITWCPVANKLQKTLSVGWVGGWGGGGQFIQSLERLARLGDLRDESAEILFQSCLRSSLTVVSHGEESVTNGFGGFGFTN